ncbi:hypothetical protein chiPu_0029625 [Chiloscyllium punctatum]|uniref:Uncharacterized protein n=1 Tax=Chiloscyllium punctatum TaxID=137246 RepID=A0A401TSK2_CHIPU|nr:hypothetical protein [Chiloscyllium punctatum]
MEPHTGVTHVNCFSPAPGRFGGGRLVRRGWGGGRVHPSFSYPNHLPFAPPPGLAVLFYRSVVRETLLPRATPCAATLASPPARGGGRCGGWGRVANEEPVWGERDGDQRDPQAPDGAYRRDARLGEEINSRHCVFERA